MTLTHNPPTAAASFRQYWLNAAFLFTAAFINMLDTTIINLALPAIQTEFSASNSNLQWTLVIYIVTFAAGLLPFGRFGDVFGRRRLFLGGLLGFTVASSACGFALTIETLILGRFCQGLAAAMMMPQVLAILHESVPEDEKAKAISLFGMVTALGAMAGPLAGGLLISADLWGLGWRMIFLVNLPFGVVAFVGAYLVLPAGPTRKRQAVDWSGAALFAVAAVALLYPVIEGRTLGWPKWLAAPVGLSFLTAAAFWRHQHHLAAQEKPQILPASLLGNPRFLTRVGIVTTMFIGIAGPIVALAMVLQLGLGLTPAGAGIALAAHPVSIMISSLASSRMGTRYLILRALFGLVLLLLGMSALQVTITATASVPMLWVPLAVIGTGVGTATVALYQLVLKEVPAADAGAGSGALQAFQQIGIALGIAVVGQVYFPALEDASDPSIYIDAMKRALWLPITIHAALCLIVLRTQQREGEHDAS
ncbi:MFS transporter [uncultured Tateyamaria sp.]|uniref:MFS transporter n=1 Tax=uncultured Tateyamaria sp. TaxID=455651 RepID=UPI00260E999C|nr:MFS transporter [uncultured Tateyamaria sp.]